MVLSGFDIICPSQLSVTGRRGQVSTGDRAYNMDISCVEPNGCKYTAHLALIHPYDDNDDGNDLLHFVVCFYIIFLTIFWQILYINEK